MKKVLDSPQAFDTSAEYISCVAVMQAIHSAPRYCNVPHGLGNTTYALGNSTYDIGNSTFDSGNGTVHKHGTVHN
jgi:hypothetical protein